MSGRKGDHQKFLDTPDAFTKFPDWLFKIGLSEHAIVVWLALRSFVTEIDPTKKARPSKRTIGNMVGLGSVNTVERGLKELQDRDLITRWNRHNQYGQASNEYTFVELSTTEIGDLIRLNEEPTPDADVAGDTTPVDRTGTPEVTSRGDMESRGEVTWSHEVRSPASRGEVTWSHEVRSPTSRDDDELEPLTKNQETKNQTDQNQGEKNQCEPVGSRPHQSCQIQAGNQESVAKGGDFSDLRARLARDEGQEQSQTLEKVASGGHPDSPGTDAGNLRERLGIKPTGSEPLEDNTTAGAEHQLAPGGDPTAGLSLEGTGNLPPLVEDLATGKRRLMTESEQRKQRLTEVREQWADMRSETSEVTEELKAKVKTRLNPDEIHTRTARLRSEVDTSPPAGWECVDLSRRGHGDGETDEPSTSAQP